MTMNVSLDCRTTDGARRMAALETIEYIVRTLEHAKVEKVSQLVGKPVEVTLEGNMFKSFRILTEVL